MTMTVSSGIYCIYFEEAYGKYYVGCSINIEKRIKEHISAFSRGNHPNAYLQNTYNKYGSPTIEILEYCSISILAEKEIYYIKQLDSFVNGFNNTNGGEGGGYGEGSNSASHKEETYILILRMLAYTNYTFSEISRYTDASVHIIKHISGLRNHGYLESIDPAAYTILRSKYKNRDNSAGTKGIVYPKLTSPMGEVHLVTNIHEFARIHGLQYQNLHKVLTGKRKVHLGWKLLV